MKEYSGYKVGKKSVYKVIELSVQLREKLAKHEANMPVLTYAVFFPSHCHAGRRIPGPSSVFFLKKAFQTRLLEVACTLRRKIVPKRDVPASDGH